MRVPGKVFTVTGGGNGIGREVVLALLARGGRVAAVDLRAESLAETVARAGRDADRLSTHVLDVTDRDAGGELPDAVLSTHGQVDGLLNIAGIIQPFVPLVDLDLSQMERVMNVNFWGVVHTTKAFLPHLLARPQASIVNVSSMGAFCPVPGQTAYGASKAAVKLLTEGLYAELRTTAVAVSVVFPGAIATQITDNSGVAAPGGGSLEDAKAAGITMTTPADAAGRIVRQGVEKGAYRVVIGRDAAMLDRLSRLVPQRATDLIAKKMAALLG